MSNRGITAFYKILETIEDKLLDDINVNTVTTGDITDIDLTKQTIFPLSHIIINSVTPQEQVLVFNVTIMSMDVVDINKENTTDRFRGNNNEHDVLNSQLAVLNRLILVLRKGTLYRDRYQLQGDPSCEPFYERFENKLAGWACTMDILIENNISSC